MEVFFTCKDLIGKMGFQRLISCLMEHIRGQQRNPPCTAFGLALLNGNWLALACALIFAVGLWGWVGLVEEKELIERFGPAYSQYRERVPAFWPRLRDLRRFYEFVITGR